MNTSEKQIPTTGFSIEQPSLDEIVFRSKFSAVGFMGGTCALLFGFLTLITGILAFLSSNTAESTNVVLIYILGSIIVTILVFVLSLVLYRTAFPYKVVIDNTGTIRRDTFFWDTTMEMDYSYIALVTDITRRKTDSGQRRMKIRYAVRILGKSQQNNDLVRYGFFYGGHKIAAQKLAYLLSYVLQIPVLDIKVQASVFESYIKRIKEHYDESDEALDIKPLNIEQRIPPKELNIDKRYHNFHINEIPKFSMPLKEFFRSDEF